MKIFCIFVKERIVMIYEGRATKYYAEPYMTNLAEITLLETVAQNLRLG